MLIQVTLGIKPRKRAEVPSSRAMRVIVIIKFDEYCLLYVETPCKPVRRILYRLKLAVSMLTFTLSIIRVLATSNGVVSPAPIPPAMLPHTAAYVAGKSSTRERDRNCSETMLFNLSYSGNCMQVKGILKYNVNIHLPSEVRVLANLSGYGTSKTSIKC